MSRTQGTSVRDFEDGSSTGILLTGVSRGRDVALRRREAELVELLLRNARTVVERERARRKVLGGEGEAHPNVVDRYVAYLRRKLGTRR